jgi:transcriptional antiterminator RfaH
MLLSLAEMKYAEMRDLWLCLKAEPKREHIAAACLRKLPEMEVFCPRIRYRKRTIRGVVRFLECMFPGYLFAKFDYDSVYRRVKQTPGVNGFVQFGDRLALVKETLIAEIKEQTGSDGIAEMDDGFVPGQNVHIACGPLEGQEAIVTRFVGARERVQILIEWMGRNLQAEASIRDLCYAPAGRRLRLSDMA